VRIDDSELRHVNVDVKEEKCMLAAEEGWKILVAPARQSTLRCRSDQNSPCIIQERKPL
jgi:hypothetical protein